MAFINEFVSPEDMDKYGLREINKKYRIADERTDWTIDKQRNIYIRRIPQFGPSDGSVRFHMYWRGELFRVFVLYRAPGLRGLREIELPNALEPRRDEVIADLKEALSVYGDGGMYGIAKDLQITFDF